MIPNGLVEVVDKVQYLLDLFGVPVLWEIKKWHHCVREAFLFEVLVAFDFTLLRL